ncbi:Mitochondrial import inner membrane translocase subunit tim8 [Lecanora helva]
MDSSLSNQDQLDISKLSDNDKRELQQTLAHEMEKAKIQGSTHNLTDLCFKKCMTAKISKGTLDRGEESCAQNCVDRFIDMQDFVMRRIAAARGQGELGS